MFHRPTTLEEARAYRYGRWAGKPRGYPHDPKQCAAEVPTGWLYGQCSRKPGHGPAALYCKQHSRVLFPAGSGDDR